MDRGAWQATIYGVSRAGHDLRDLKNNNTEKILRDLNQVRNKADGLYNKVSIKNNFIECVLYLLILPYLIIN